MSNPKIHVYIIWCQNQQQKQTFASTLNKKAKKKIKKANQVAMSQKDDVPKYNKNVIIGFSFKNIIV